jgi:hypothetical protein
MTRIELAERRIAAKELELARIQFEESTPLQIEANLARGALHQTLTTAAVMARAICDALALPIDEHIEELSRDFLPKG